MAISLTHGQLPAQGKVVVITGANAGIGLATALGLARLGAEIVLICRDAKRGKAAVRAVAQAASTPPSLFIADLSSQRSIHELSAALHKQFTWLDVLINNAAAAFARRELTEQVAECSGPDERLRVDSGLAEHPPLLEPAP